MKKAITTILAILTLVTVVVLPASKANAASAGASNFVTQLYRICMDRNPAASEVTYWADKLDQDESTACTVAYDFVFSDEFQRKNMSDSEYVSCMYQLFMRREASSAEINYWAGAMANGMSREEIFAGFANSPEFDNCCDTNHIITGIYISGYDRTQVLKVNLFVNRLYDIIMGRRCDTAGMIYWTKTLLNKEITGKDIVTSFINSDEFVAMNVNNDAFVTRIYAVMLNRTPAAEETNYWSGALSSGGARNDLVHGFAASPEFFALCITSGIDNGALVTGWVNLDKPYYYKNSVRYTGWLKENNNWYYINEGLKKTGWQEYRNNWYYLDTDGVMVTGLKRISGSYYYFDSEGVMVTGWQKINGKWHYFDELGKMIVNGWVSYEDNWYYFDGDGVMVAGTRRYINGNDYLFRDNGIMVTGWYKIGDDWHYFGDNGIEYKDKWLSDNNHWYYFNYYGNMVTGLRTISNVEYYFATNGQLQTGWVNINNKWLYFTNNGRDTSKTGFQNINGNYYYITHSDGSYFINSRVLIDGEYYYFRENGVMVTGWYVSHYEYNGDEYSALYCFAANGVAYRNIWLDYNGQTVYIGEDGSALTGHRMIDGNWYYFKSDWTLARNEYVYVPGRHSSYGGPMHDYNQIWYASSNGVCTFVRNDCGCN